MNFVNAPTWIRYCACDASRTAPWPALAVWLTESEQAALAELSAPARQSQWLWGRWLSKQMIGSVAPVEDFREIEIITRGEQRLGVPPQVKLASLPWCCALSIAHTETGVLVGLSLDEHIAIGVDLACDVPLDPNFRSLWFTAGEQQWIASDPAYRTNLLWGLKEAVFKACSAQAGGDSHRWTPAQIEIEPTAEGSFQAVFFGNPLGRLHVQVQNVARGLAVVVCLPRQIVPHPDWSSAPWSTQLRGSAVTPSELSLTPAITKEFIAAEMPAFDVC